MPQLTLYFHEFCPFCRKVLTFMEENNIKLNMKNVEENSENRLELEQKGGKSQVPALQINDTIKYESDDIINWLKENYQS